MDTERRKELRDDVRYGNFANRTDVLELLDALDAAEARAIELETQLVPLQQQFDDWAEQNRRARAWSAAWKRKAKEFRDWYFYAEKHIFRSQELSQRVKELEADNARLRAALEAAAEYLSDVVADFELSSDMPEAVVYRKVRQALGEQP